MFKDDIAGYVGRHVLIYVTSTEITKGAFFGVLEQVTDSSVKLNPACKAIDIKCSTSNYNAELEAVDRRGTEIIIPLGKITALEAILSKQEEEDRESLRHP